MQVVILAGGKGTRLSEETKRTPKPMVNIGEFPIIWHIMNHYANFGHKDFIIALGYKGYVLKEYFANYKSHNADFSVDLSDGSISTHSFPTRDWKVTLVDTGEDTMTGGRILRLKEFLDERFMLTYGDGLSDVNIADLIDFHDRQKTLATVTAVSPPPRFGALEISNGMVRHFNEKPIHGETRINGGFFVLEKEILDLISEDSTIFEKHPLNTLAESRQLSAFEHNGFWMPMDTLREREELESIWNSGNAPWK
jgi:glucose-1-phosphate cytidylyltransferase